MSKIKFLTTAVVLILSCYLQPCFAQNITISGTVSDPNGVGLSGATISVKGSNLGTQTNTQGGYTISAPGNSTLVFSTVGFATQEIGVEGRTSVNVTLTASNASLNEVVVIGYGSVRRRDLTGAVTSISAKNFNQGVVAAPENLIQGKVAGLMVTNNSGQPGAATTVKIRGNNSVRSGNNPLYVIDGIPLDGRTPRPTINLNQNGTGLGITPESNPLIYLNPNDIAEVSVLKDASATAIYGSRGANGVILITTKRGTAGSPRVEVNASAGVSGIMKKVDVLTPGEYRQALKTYNVKSDSGGNVNALKAILRNAITQNYSLAFSGGNDVGKYRVSVLASNQQGIIRKTGLEKYVANLNGQYMVLDRRLTIDFNMTAAQYTEDIGPVTNTAGSSGNIISDALNWNPTLSLKNRNGLYNLQGGGSFNPLALSDAFSDEVNATAILGNISATLRLTNFLNYRFLFGVNHGTAVRKINIQGWYNEPGISGQGIGILANGALSSKTYTHTLNFNKSLSEDFNLTALAGYEYWTTNYSGSTFGAYGFATNLTQEGRTNVPYTSFLQSSVGTNRSISSFADPKVDLQSYFARAIFNFKDKYLLTGTIRADGSSKFGTNNKYGYFPAIAAAWNISNEDFLEGSNTFSDVKLRLGWGKTGNQEFPAGASQEQWNFSSNTAISLSNVANPDLKWETTTSTNIGVDFSLFGNKVSVTADYFKKNTTDVLFQLTAIQPAPSTQYFINLPGNIINEGVELSFSTTLISKEDFTWNFGANATYLRNKFTNYSGPLILTGAINGQGVSGTFAQAIATNQPVNVFYLKEFTGFNQSGVSQIGANPNFAGDPNPHALLGISTEANFKKFTFIVNMHGAFGFKVYNNTATSITNLGIITTGKNIGSFNIGSAQSVTDGVAASTRYLESGNFLKLNNATVRYNLGSVGNWARGANVFVSGRNLFVLTKFTGFDPEVNVDKSNNNVPSLSIEYIPYPTARTILFGVNFTL